MAATRLQNRVLDLWRSKRPAVTAWLCVGNAFTAEAMARQGFDACLVDCQVRARMGVRMGLGMGMRRRPSVSLASSTRMPVRRRSERPTDTNTIPHVYTARHDRRRHGHQHARRHRHRPRRHAPGAVSKQHASSNSQRMRAIGHRAAAYAIDSIPKTHAHPHVHRVRCNQPDKIHFLLDAGALGIVCPLINTPQARLVVFEPSTRLGLPVSSNQPPPPPPLNFTLPSNPYTNQEVREFVAACKYPPQGKRSFGPGRCAFASRFVGYCVGQGGVYVYV